MNGFIATAARSACLLGGLLSLVGCAHYRDVVDPCYPERYMAISRKNTKEAFGPQVQNGVVLDQTVWNSFFEPGTAKLNAPGIDHLNALIRRRPAPLSTVYVQSAHNVPYNPAKPQEFQKARDDLNALRKKSVENYLVAVASNRNLHFNVEVHDPATPGQFGVYANSTQRWLQLGPPYGAMRPIGQQVTQIQVQGNTAAFP